LFCWNDPIKEIEVIRRLIHAPFEGIETGEAVGTVARVMSVQGRELGHRGSLELTQKLNQPTHRPITLFSSQALSHSSLHFSPLSPAHPSNLPFTRLPFNSPSNDHRQALDRPGSQQKQLFTFKLIVAFESVTHAFRSVKLDLQPDLWLDCLRETDLETIAVPAHWGRNVVFGNLMLTISLILVILFIVLVLLGLLFLFMLQHRRRLAKAQEAQYMQAQFRNGDQPGMGPRALLGPTTGRQMPKIPPEEMDQKEYEEYEPPRYEMNFLPATRHQANHADEKDMIYETILEEDDEERLIRQMHLCKEAPVTPVLPSNRLDIPEYLEIRPATPDRKYANLYANQ
jgi:hypothetical protein